MNTLYYVVMHDRRQNEYVRFAVTAHRSCETEQEREKNVIDRIYKLHLNGDKLSRSWLQRVCETPNDIFEEL